MTSPAQPAHAAAIGSVNKVVAIGDSYPAGSEGNEGNAYPERYARRTGHAATINRARGGWRTTDVLYMFANSASAKPNVRDVRTVVVTVGANDVMFAKPDPRAAANGLQAYNPAIAEMRKNLHKVLGTISAARKGNNKGVIVTTYNNIYQDGSAGKRNGWAFEYGADRVTRSVNASIIAECKYYKMTCVDVYPSFNVAGVDKLVTSDGTHPSSAGHQVYANRLYAARH